MTETLASITAEKNALASRLAELCNCISGAEFAALPDAQKQLVQRQATHMAHLVDVLNARVLAWS